MPTEDKNYVQMIGTLGGHAWNFYFTQDNRFVLKIIPANQKIFYQEKLHSSYIKLILSQKSTLVNKIYYFF